MLFVLERVSSKMLVSSQRRETFFGAQLLLYYTVSSSNLKSLDIFITIPTFYTSEQLISCLPKNWKTDTLQFLKIQP